jgi:hypothetical protein
MTKLDLFRKLIREEVRQVIREEIKPILAEIKSGKGELITPRKTFREDLKESVTQRPVRKPAPSMPKITTSDPIQQLIQETAYGMNQSEYRTLVNADASMTQGLPQMYTESEQYVSEPMVVESVQEMLAQTGPVSDINQVSIDAVPDFSEMMSVLKSKGQI